MNWLLHLGRNLSAMLILGVALLLLAAGTGVILQNETLLHRQRVEDTRVQAEILAASVRAAVDFDDASAAQEAADAMRANRQIRGVAVYDRNGDLIAGYRRDQRPLAPSVRASREAARLLQGKALIAERPVVSGGQRVGTVRVSSDPQPFEARLGRYALVGLLAVMAALVVGVLGASQAALRRVNRTLEERAEALAEANRQLEVQMEQRAQAEEQLRQAQKMQALGQLTGGIAHDFNNLLTVIQGSAEMLQRPELSEAKRARYADAVLQAAARAASLTGQLLAFARRQPLQPEVIDVNAMLDGMSELLDRTLGERFTIRTRLASNACTVGADRAQLVSAILNIAVNARDAMPGGGTLSVTTARVTSDQGPMVAIAMKDTGSGMDPATLDRALEPFFTTKSAGKGTGLGLSQVYGFASQSGGDLQIDSRAGLGTTVTILLPFSDAAPPAPQPSDALVTPRRAASVLLVEDNEDVGTFAEALLGELGHEVTRARNGAEALALADAQHFDLVFSDVVMPVMSGLELSDRLRATQPETPVVLTTGFSDQIAQSGAGGRPVLLKPYRLETLAAVLDEAIG